jgi:hypothetical protein
MKTVKDLKIYELKNHEMKNLFGGYVGHLPPGTTYYRAYATNPSGTTMHLHTDASWDITMAWMRAWEALGWTVAVFEDRIPSYDDGPRVYMT